MVKAKNQDLVFEMLVLLLFALYPFGQIVKASGLVFGSQIRINALDLVVLALAFSYLRKYPKTLAKLKKSQFLHFFILLFFSFLLSIFSFSFRELLIGGFYLMRFISYFILVSFFGDTLKEGKLNGAFLKKCLLLVSFVAALFGWIQYLFLPDLTNLKFYHWDDHLGRLVGTFLDPGFSGIIFSLTAILAFDTALKEKRKLLFLVFGFFFTTTVFTYSRTSFLALISGLTLVIFSYFKTQKAFLLSSLIILGFLLLLFILPKEGSVGVDLSRTFSVFARLENYQETLNIFLKNPLFGVGFNNLCAARQKYLGLGDYVSHSCSGADSSLLFTLATMGILGTFAFLRTLFLQFKRIGDILLTSSVACVAVSSFLVNSFYYPWIMVFLGILFAVAESEASKRKVDF